MGEKIKDLEEELLKIKETMSNIDFQLKYIDVDLATLKKEQLKQETPKRWRAKEGVNIYFYIKDNLGLDWEDEKFNMTDNNRYNIGNYFASAEEAKEKLEHLEIEQQLKDIALRLNNGKDMDWEEEGQWKYVLYYDFDDDNIEDDYFDTTKYQGCIYCLDRNFKDIAIAEIGEERLKNYLKEC